MEALSWLAAASAVLLVAAYGIGAPFFLLRTLLTLGKRRRLRYRTRNDDVLATSRFTIPVSLIVPLDADVDDAPHRVRHLLQLRYPELELIVVVSAGSALEDLKHGLSLSAAEVFYRKSLAGAAVRGLYRSSTDARVIVVQSEPASVGEALNCGVNLARYRYLAVVDAPATYNSDALLESMQAALEEPQRVVGATTSLSVHPVEGFDAALRGEAPAGLVEALRYLSAARTRLVTIGRRRLDLPPEGCPGFTIWRQRRRARGRRLRRGRDRGPCGHDAAGARPFRRGPAALPHHPRRRACGPGRAGRRRAAGTPGSGDVRPDVAPQGAASSTPATAGSDSSTCRGTPSTCWWPRGWNCWRLCCSGWPCRLGVLTGGHLLLVLVTIGLGNGILTASALLLTGLAGSRSEALGPLQSAPCRTIRVLLQPASSADRTSSPLVNT